MAWDKCLAVDSVVVHLRHLNIGHFTMYRYVVAQHYASWSSSSINNADSTEYRRRDICSTRLDPLNSIDIHKPLLLEFEP